MKIPLTVRLQEWAAEKYPDIQFPERSAYIPKKKRDWQPYKGTSAVIKVDQNSGEARLTWVARLLLFYYGIVGIVIFGTILIVLLGITWALIFG